MFFCFVRSGNRNKYHENAQKRKTLSRPTKESWSEVLKATLATNRSPILQDKQITGSGKDSSQSSFSSSKKQKTSAHTGRMFFALWKEKLRADVLPIKASLLRRHKSKHNIP